MKPIYLEFCGVNSFSEKTQIDFRALLSGGVFGIFGDTGSGKSTILDCIHLALYGRIERASKSMNDFINYKSESAYVIFDFELTMNGQRHTYRVRRERKRKSGTAKAFLYEYTDGEWLALAEGTNEVDGRLENIIGLSFEDFKMCIALPQGDFAALVKATAGDRVKLVSRLFDLEKYGESLSKAANEKYYQAEQEVNLIKAEMGQNEGGKDEFIEAKQLELATAKQALNEANEAFKKAELAYESEAALYKEKLQYDEVCRRLEEMKALLPQMEEKRKAAERIPMAKAVYREAQAVKKNHEETQNAKGAVLTAEERVKSAVLALETAVKAQENSGLDEKIMQAAMAVEKVRGAADDLKAEREAENKRNACREEYREYQKRITGIDFALAIAEKEAQVSALGDDDNLFDYIKRHCKDMLLADAYQGVRDDLTAIGGKYPQTQADIQILLKKYTLSQANGEVDFTALQGEFKEIEQQCKALRLQIQNLQKQQIEEESARKRMEDIQKMGEHYRDLLDEWKRKNAEISALGDLSALEKNLENLQTEKRRLQSGVEKAQEYANACRAELEKQKALVARGEKEAIHLQNALQLVLKESGFVSVQEAEDLLLRLRDEEAVKTECKNFFEKYDLYRHKYEETDRDKLSVFSEERLQNAQREKISAQENRDIFTRQVAAFETELKRLEELREKYRAFEKTLKEKEKARDLCDELRSLLRNNRFLEYIASEYLQEVCVAASKTLRSLTGGRYFLKYDKEFKVGDNLDGGNLRAVKTLSGGETFLVSLSLALSLSAAICQKSLRPIEFFFLDEGFGTLDGKLVDTVMDVLGKLSKSFSVGLISHVEELKHRIDNKLLVTGANDRHGSQVKMERF